MSDGVSDENVVGRISRALDDAAYRLREAIERAEQGDRELTVEDVEHEVNDVLRGSGYVLRREM